MAIAERQAIRLAQSRSVDERAIYDLTRELAESWNRGDGAAFASVFTEDSDYIAFDGTRLVGRRANAEHHQRLFDTVLKDSRAVYGEASLRFIGPDVAILIAEGSVLLPWHRNLPAHRRSIQTYVAVRTDGLWRFTAFHNTRMRPVRVPVGWTLRVILFFMRVRTLLTARAVAE